jgi:BirA family transcriptional regulator, biotin operon repressor / biotin---[acetyl-CoA-carboxylase] ligase
MHAICPTVEEFRRFIQDHELPLRSRTLADAALVLRYGAFVGSALEHHDSLERTMDRARTLIDAVENADRSVISGTVIIARTLSCSRGRFSRSWHAPAGGLWGCLIHANTLLPASRRFLSLAVGVACCEAVRQVGAAEACLRWVNDVLIDQKKAAGFLIQGYSGPRRHDEYDLIGFGINLNNRSFPEELRTTAISLAEKIGHPVDLHHFTLVFLAKLSWNLGLVYFEEARDLSGEGYSGEGGEHMLLKSWKNLSDTVGRRVVYGQNVFEAPLYQATVVDLKDDGALLLQLDDGSYTTVQSGEIRYI